MPATMAQTVSADLAHTYGMPNTTRQSGIYRIDNTVSGGFYIGSSVNIPRRFVEHRHHLNKGTHSNPILLAAWRKYGADAFRFSVVALLPDGDLLEAEGRLLQQVVPLPNCYNIAIDPQSGMKGRTATPETRAKLSAAHRGRPMHPNTRAALIERNRRRTMTPEHKERLRSMNIGKTLTAEHREKVSRALKGKRKGEVRTPAQRAKLSEACKGRSVSAAAREKIAKANLGRKHTDAARAKMSASATRWQQGRVLPDSTKDKLRAFNTGKKVSPESIRKSVESRAGYTASEETRAKISKAKRGQPLPVNHPAWGGTWNVGRKHRQDSIEKMRAAATGKTVTAESRAKISAKAEGRTLSPGHKAKLREANTGRVKSDAERAKLSAARRAWWERKRQETA